MITRERTLEVESRSFHLQRIEYVRLHGSNISSAEFHLGIEHVRTGVSCSGRHQVGILKQLTELGGRLHAAEKGERTGGSDVSVFEDPFQVLTRHSCAGADEMFDKNTLCCSGIADPKTRKQSCYRRLPGQSVLVDQLGE